MFISNKRACDDFNDAMPSQMISEIYKLLCTDKIDETAATSKWNKKRADQLEKLNCDCNMTAGLQAKLRLAVRAQGMLCRDIDTKFGLVISAMGTILAITASRITIQFDHISELHHVQLVKGRFIVEKLLCIQERIPTYPSICSHYS